MSERMRWQNEGRDWPHREASRFVEAGGVRWHVQTMSSPRAASAARHALLLVHGTGASTHSWRGVMKRLARSFDVIAPDLPGHGFSGEPRAKNYSLPGMAAALSELLKALGAAPTVVVGHSAGAAILLRMCLDRLIAPHQLVSVNGALLPLHGLAGELFSPLAKVFASSAIVPRLFAWRASAPHVLDRLLRSTGSNVDEEGRRLYGALVRNPHHAGAALEMMAQWDLWTLERDLPRFVDQRCALTLMVGENDRTISPGEAVRVKQILPAAQLVSMPGLGHLAHEERPELLCELLEGLDVLEAQERAA
jgi:magnesium chelatase accessory protein